MHYSLGSSLRFGAGRFLPFKLHSLFSYSPGRVSRARGLSLLWHGVLSPPAALEAPTSVIWPPRSVGFVHSSAAPSLVAFGAKNPLLTHRCLISVPFSLPSEEAKGKRERATPLPPAALTCIFAKSSVCNVFAFGSTSSFRHHCQHTPMPPAH